MMTTTTSTMTRTDRSRTGAAAAATPRAGGDTRAGSGQRSWAPVWVRPAGAVPAALRRAAGVSVSTVATVGPARLDEATRRLLRVPSLVAETAHRLGARPADTVGTVGTVGTPERSTRRRPRRAHTRRPASGLLRVTPALGAGGGCDAAPHRPSTTTYRMSRGARLSLTITVFAAVVVMAANALLTTGPTGTAQVTVTAGDTLWSIAERAAPDDEVWSTIDEISALNGLIGSAVVPGQVLTVPVG